MSSLTNAILTDEAINPRAEMKSTVEPAKPFLVPNEGEHRSGSVTDRVEAIVDFLLAQGSMPA